MIEVSFILEKKENELNDDNGELRKDGGPDRDIFFWIFFFEKHELL